MMSKKVPELLEALDENGKPTGQHKTWLQLIGDKDWYNVIHVWVINSRGQLLVQRRADKGAWDGLWDISVGGQVSAGENPNKTVVRELKEELGLDIKLEELKRLGVWNVKKHIPEQNKESQQFSHTYLLVKDFQLKDLNLQKEEVAEVAWKSLSDMRKQIEDDKLYKSWVPHPREYYLEVMGLIEKIDG